jgi:spore coat polysaccharide biosynthesis protein SpsF
MRIVGIIQQRMGSTRLPGKALLPLAGVEMTSHIYARAKRAGSLDRVILAIPVCDEQAMLHLGIKQKDYFAYDGDESDLIGRYLAAAKSSRADIIVRICGDNPCLEPRVIDYSVSEYLYFCKPFVSTMGDYQHSQWPDGIGCEVFSVSRLRWLDEKTQGMPGLREHPHRWFHENHAVYEPTYRGPVFPRGLALDVNTQAEYEYVNDIFEAMYPTNPIFGISDIVNYLASKEAGHAAVAG